MLGGRLDFRRVNFMFCAWSFDSDCNFVDRGNMLLTLQVILPVLHYVFCPNSQIPAKLSKLPKNSIHRILNSNLKPLKFNQVLNVEMRPSFVPFPNLVCSTTADLMFGTQISKIFEGFLKLHFLSSCIRIRSHRPAAT
jgi:hypothetical protein